jgi:hypothetical protein
MVDELFFHSSGSMMFVFRTYRGGGQPGLTGEDPAQGSLGARAATPDTKGNQDFEAILKRGWTAES